MKSQDAVYDLVKSLSKQEKRYFKLYASRHMIKGSNKHLLMFEHFTKAKNYDEDELKVELDDPLLSKRFAVAKYQLGQHVLRSLASFHAFNSVDARIHERIQQIRILYSKALLDQCRKLIRSTKEICYKYEKYSFLIQLIDIERSYLIITKFHKDAYSDVLEIRKEKEQAIRKIQSVKACMDIADEFYMLRNTLGRVRNAEQRKLLNDLVSDPVFAEESLALTDLAKIWWHRAQVGYGYLVGNNRHWLEHAYKMVALFDANPDLIVDNVRFYLSSLFILGYAQFESRLISEARRTLAKMKKVEIDYPKAMDTLVRGYMFEVVYALELRSYILEGEFEKGRACAEEVELLLGKYNDKISKSDELVLWFLLAVLFFGLKEYRKSLKWINAIVDTASTHTREDLQSAARIMNLICHYEMEHREYLPYVYRSTIRYLSNRERLFPLEKQILKALQNMNDIVNERELQKILKTLKLNIAEQSGDKEKLAASTEFDFDAWLTSKVERKDFAQIVKNKWGTYN